MSEPRNTCLHPEGYADSPYEGDEYDDLAVPDPAERPCPRCKGTGLDRNEWEDCDNCLGEGTILIPLPEFSQDVNQIPR